MNHAHTLQLLAEATERAIGIHADYISAYADYSPLDDYAYFKHEINQLKRHWLVEARTISRLADSMMGIEP